MPHDPKPIPSFDAASAPRSPRCHALIPCAGSGSRSGRTGPKQYEQLAGQRLVDHTLAAFLALPQLASIALVVAPDDDSLSSPDPRVQLLRVGGASRAASVHNGLRALLQAGVDARDWVMVHDAARCLILPQQIAALIEACRDDPVGGLLALPLPDTLKAARADEAGARVAATLARDDKWLAQTPQMFRLGALEQALAAAEALGYAGITDEASALEAGGLSPRLVRGSAQNFKVTYPEDFALAEALLRLRASAAAT
ncbi:2-C-methyl-D-erythritol 4-phosphate cytidylyltransferase [Malikia spinosa]|uniref:2-C-methyl-D-erythritol 4-phosphate cytidylyltransferase n=2 Tax=Malikia spinosa TaxID=86180 RepID=UPI000A921044